jgi:hypothetical protein
MSYLFIYRLSGKKTPIDSFSKCMDQGYTMNFRALVILVTVFHSFLPIDDRINGKGSSFTI